MPDVHGEKKKRIREQELGEGSETEAAPPDDGGHQGDFSRPDEELQVREKRPRRQGQELPGSDGGPPLADDPQSKRRRRAKRIVGDRD